MIEISKPDQITIIIMTSLRLELTMLPNSTIQKSDKSDKVEHNSLIGSKNQLYNKFEIIKLREKYIKSCQVNADIEIVDYVTQHRNACEALKKYN